MLCFVANLMALLASSAVSTVTYFAGVELAADQPGRRGEPCWPMFCMPAGWSASHRGSEKWAPFSSDVSNGSTSTASTPDSASSSQGAASKHGCGRAHLQPPQAALVATPASDTV